MIVGIGVGRNIWTSTPRGWIDSKLPVVDREWNMYGNYACVSDNPPQVNILCVYSIYVKPVNGAWTKEACRVWFFASTDFTALGGTKPLKQTERAT